MAALEFLNRSASLAEVGRFVTAAAGPKVLCITGPVGCGKSELLRQASARWHRRPFISVDRGELGDGSPPAPVWMLLAEAIDRQAVAQGFPPRRTLSSERKRKAIAAAETAIAVAARAFRPLAVLKELAERTRDLSEATAIQDPDKVFVRHAVGSVPCALHVDHADRCAEEDWRFLSTLLSTTGCNLLIEGPPGFEVPIALSGDGAHRIRLAALEDAFVSVLFDRLPAGLGDALRPAFEASGNLKPYADVARRADLMPVRRQGSAIAVGDSLRRFSAKAVSALTPDDLTVLVALSAHLGETVTMGMLRRFLAFSGKSPALTTDVVASLRRLVEEVVLVATSDGYEVPGTVLEVVLGDARLRNARLLQLQRWRDFYLKPENCGLPLADRRRCLQILRHCVALQDVVGISVTLEAVGTASAGADVRTDMATFTKWLAFRFDLKAEPVVADACARYLYGAGWFEDARNVLTAAGEPSDRRTRYFMAELYCTAGPLDRGLRMVEHERVLLGETIDPDAELCLELVDLHGLRNANRYGDARRQFKTAMNVQRYKTCRAYAVLLRSADFCLMLDGDLDECCLLLEEAAHLSWDRGDMQEAASTYVALCQQHGYHNLDRAREHLARAELISRSSWVEMPAILANEAVLALYRGEIETEGVSLLEDALVLTTDPGDEVLVRLNLLVHRLMAGDRTGNGIPELERLLHDSVADAEITRIVHFNLERACLDLGREVDARRHGLAWRSVNSDIDEAFWAYRRSGRRHPALPHWRLDMSYYPVLLSHWKLGAIPFDAVRNDR